jgi:hypothetical protein
MSDETRLIPLAVCPARRFSALCKAGGRFGAHNIDMNRQASKSRSGPDGGGQFLQRQRAPIRSRITHPVIGYLIAAAPATT